MNVICYKRVSTDEQADQGFSLQHQEIVLTYKLIKNKSKPSTNLAQNKKHIHILYVSV